MSREIELAVEIDSKLQESSIFDRRVPRRDVLKLLGLGTVAPSVLIACGTSATAAPTAAPPSATAAPTAAPASATAAPTAAPASATAAPTAAPASATAAPTAAPPSASAAPTAASSAQPGTGLIRAGAYEAGTTWTWNTWSSFGQDDVWNWCTQRLVSVAPDGTVLYEAAQSYEVSPDGLEWTFKLAPGIKWHDGTPLTAKDVAFTYNTSLKAKAGSNTIGVATPFKGSKAVIDDNSQNCEGIVVIDDQTIKFILDKPNAQILPTSFAQLRLMPAHYFDGIAVDQYAKQDVNTKLAVGSGAYRMTENNGGVSFKLEAYSDFISGDGYTGPPGAASVSVIVYPDPNAQLVSAQTGEVDISYYRKPTGDQLKSLDAIQGMHTQKSLVGYNIFFSFNLLAPTAPLLKDKRVRQAMVWALDRDTLINDVLGGVVGLPSYMNQWISPWANSDKLESYHPQNIDKAKQLLTEAGWDSSAVLDVRCNPPIPTDDIPVILKMWEDVGIKTKLTPTADDVFVPIFYESKGPKGSPDQGPSYDVFFTYGFGTLDGSPWGSDATLGTGRVYPNGSNSMRYSNPEWDSEFAAALLETEQEGQAPHFKRCSEIFNDELPYVPAYQRVDYSVISDKLKGPEAATILHPAAGGVKYWEWSIG